MLIITDSVSHTDSVIMDHFSTWSILGGFQTFLAQSASSVIVSRMMIGREMFMRRLLRSVNLLCQPTHVTHTALQRQNTVSAYLNSKQILPFASSRHT